MHELDNESKKSHDEKAHGSRESDFLEFTSVRLRAALQQTNGVLRELLGWQQQRLHAVGWHICDREISRQ